MRDKAFFFEQASRARGELRRRRGDRSPIAPLAAFVLLALYLLALAASAWR